MQNKMDAVGAAQPFAQQARSFIEALNETGLSVNKGLGVYRNLQKAEYQNTDTKNIASGKATLFLTSQDVKLNIRDLNLGHNTSDEHHPDL